MTNSGSRQDDSQPDDVVLEPVPTDLLPIHRRLEDDGGSWRAALPPLEQLLRRVKPPRTPRSPRLDSRLDSRRASYTETPTARPRVLNAMPPATTTTPTTLRASAPRARHRRKPSTR